MEADSTRSGLTIDAVPIGRNGKARVTAQLNGKVVALESFDLTKSKARAAFIDALCAEGPGIDRKALETELLCLAAQVASTPEAPPQATSQPDSAALLAAMPEVVRAQARAMLESSDLFKHVVDDIALLGVAGEKELTATIYLVGTSRLLTEPLAAIVQGPTASGKSYVIWKVASLFPAEAIIVAT